MKTEVLKNYILNLYHENKLSHAYLIETNNINLATSDLISIIKELNCENSFSNKCNKCNICHLIDTFSLPSFIFIKPEGKFIKKESIDLLKKSFSQKPIYTKNNIYLIQNPEKMNSASFNSMLKFLEEPEENIIGFFLTDNKDNVASTIVSRLNCIKLLYEIENKTDEELLNLAHKYFCFQSNKPNLVYYNVKELFNILDNREKVVTFLKILYTIYDKSLFEDYIFNLKQMKIIAKYLEQLNYNVNISLLLDSFAIEMSE